MLRDIVGGGGCEGGNDVRHFANFFDKDGARLQQRKEFLNFEEYQQFNQAHSTPREAEMFLRGEIDFNERINHDFHEFAEFDHMFDQRGPPGPHLPVAAMSPAMQLDSLFKSLLHMDARPNGPVDNAALRLSPMDKERVCTRASALARHCCTSPIEKERMGMMLDRVFRVLGINVNPLEVLHEDIVQLNNMMPLSKGWADDYAQNAHRFDQLAGRGLSPQEMQMQFRDMESIWQNQERQRMNEVWNMERSREGARMAQAWREAETGNKWRNQYQRWDGFDPTLTEQETKQFEQAWEDAKMSTGNAWADEMKQMEQKERQDEEHWFSQFCAGGNLDTTSMEAPSSVGSRWALEYQRDRNIPISTGNQWANEYARTNPRALEKGNEWSQEFQQEEKPPQTANLQEMVDRIHALDNPKLLASNFLKFIDEINSGQIPIEPA